jgi:DNA-binding NtrC family response regulator
MEAWKPGEPLERLILQAVAMTLAKCKGNKTKAARLLGISIRKIRYMVQEHPELECFRGSMRDRYPDH